MLNLNINVKCLIYVLNGKLKYFLAECQVKHLVNWENIPGRMKWPQRTLTCDEFSPEWSEYQTRAEITAIFRGAFALSEHQPFPLYFLSTIKGSKKTDETKHHLQFSLGW